MLGTLESSLGNNLLPWGTLSPAGQWTSNESYVIDNLIAAVKWVEESLEASLLYSPAPLLRNVSSAGTSYANTLCMWYADRSQHDDVESVLAIYRSQTGKPAIRGSFSSKLFVWPSHVIAPYDSDAPSASSAVVASGISEWFRRSRIALLGICTNATFVNPGWLKDCVRRNAFISTTKYELNEVRVEHPINKWCNDLRAPPLFDYAAFAACESQPSRRIPYCRVHKR